MAQNAKLQPEKEDIFFKAVGTLFLFAGVIYLDRLIEDWFPTLKLINAFSTMLVFAVWIIFVYFCFQFYRASKLTETAKFSIRKKHLK